MSDAPTGFVGGEIVSGETAVTRPLGEVGGGNRARVRVALTGKAFELGTLALLITLVPRRLGPGAYGDFALALAVVTIGSISLSLGGAEVLSRFVPAASPGERARVARALAGRLALSRGLLIGLAAVVGVALAAGDPDRFPPLLTGLVVLALVLDGAATLAFQTALGLGRVAVWSFRYPIQNAVTVAASLGLFELWGVKGAIAGLAVASGGALAMGGAAIARPLLGAQTGGQVPRGALRFGAIQALSGLLNQIVHRGGVVAVAVLGGSSVQQGYAGVAIGVGIAATYVVWQAFLVQLPLLAERWETDAPGVEATVRRLARHTLLVVVPCAVVAELLVRPGLPLALGDDYRGAADAFGPALALLPLAALTAVGSQASILGLRPLARLWTTVAGAATFVCVAAGAVPAWGATGAAVALLGGTAATVVASAVAFPRLATPRLVAAALAGSAAVVVVAALR